MEGKKGRNAAIPDCRLAAAVYPPPPPPPPSPPEGGEWVEFHISVRRGRRTGSAGRGPLHFGAGQRSALGRRRFLEAGNVLRNPPDFFGRHAESDAGHVLAVIVAGATLERPHLLLVVGGEL